MSAMRTAPGRAPAPFRERERQPLAPLHLVEAEPQRRSRALTRLVTVLAAVSAAAGLFLVVFLHVLLTQGQAELDGLRNRADAEAARNRRLRVQIAELESPARIVSAARDRLGMVPPSTVVYLPPADPTKPLPPVSSEPLPPPTTVARSSAPTTPATQARPKSSPPTTVRRASTPTTVGRTTTPTTTGATSSSRR